MGGLAVCEGQVAMVETLDARPHYMMGGGKPDNIMGAVERGIDMFDCVLPTGSGRNSQAFTWDGPANLKNARHAEARPPMPLDAIADVPRAVSLPGYTFTTP